MKTSTLDQEQNLTAAIEKVKDATLTIDLILKGELEDGFFSTTERAILIAAKVILLKVETVITINRDGEDPQITNQENHGSERTESPTA